MAEKKPLVDVECQCAACGADIRVKVHRKRTNPVEPAIYEYDTNVVLKAPLYDKKVKKDVKKDVKKKGGKK